MRHHVTPMAGGIADRQKDQLVLRLGAGQRLRPPRIPIDGVILMLKQIGRRFASESIGHAGSLQWATWILKYSSLRAGTGTGGAAGPLHAPTSAASTTRRAKTAARVRKTGAW